MGRLIIKNIFPLVLISFLTTSCSYENESELFGEPGDCDTFDMSYQNDVLPILESRCITCHNNQDKTGGVVLEGYTEVKVYVSNGKLIGTIKQLPGFSPMPQGSGPISDCNIATIESWISDGSPNN